MRNVPMIALAFLVTSIGAFNTPTVSAQIKTCSLKLHVVTDRKDPIRMMKVLDGARATALNTGNRKSTAAVWLDGYLGFSKLTDGEYRLTVTKPGFKRAIQPVSFKCEEMNGSAWMSIDLDPGNFRRSAVAKSESVVARSPPPVRRGVTTVLGNDSSSDPKSGILKGKAISLPKPDYPPIARQAHASGTV